MVPNVKNTTTSVKRLVFECVNVIFVLLNIKKKKKKKKRLVTEDGTDVTPKDRADHFNNFFMNVGFTLASKYATDASKINSPVNENRFTFSKTNAKCVDHIKNLRNGKATGLDGIATRILKAGKIFNYSLATGYLSKCWKMKRVSPVHKLVLVILDLSLFYL